MRNALLENIKVNPVKIRVNYVRVVIGKIPLKTQDVKHVLQENILPVLVELQIAIIVQLVEFHLKLHEPTHVIYVQKAPIKIKQVKVLPVNHAHMDGINRQKADLVVHVVPEDAHVLKPVVWVNYARMENIAKVQHMAVVNLVEQKKVL